MGSGMSNVDNDDAPRTFEHQEEGQRRGNSDTSATEKSSPIIDNEARYSENEKCSSESESKRDGGKFEYEDDSISLDSKDSDDTLVLSSRMDTYLRKDNTDDSDIPVETGTDGSDSPNKECQNESEQTAGKQNGTKQTIDHDDIIELVADENNVVLNTEFGEENPYEIDTIAYYISKANWQDENGQIKEANTDDKGHPDDEDPIKHNGSSENNSESKANENIQQYSDTKHQMLSPKNNKPDAFDVFRKLYSSRQRMPRKPSISKRQTLILVKVGSQYKYVAVPAYLPGQRLCRPSSFTKGFTDRAQYLPKIQPLKPIKGMSTLCSLVTLHKLHVYDWFTMFYLRFYYCVCSKRFIRPSCI